MNDNNNRIVISRLIVIIYHVQTLAIMTIDRISLLPPTGSSLFFYVCVDLLTLEIDGDRTRL